MLKVNDLKKMSDNKGISYKNKSTKSFSITGKTDCIYQIVLYHMGNSIDEKNIKYHLVNEKNKYFDGTLSSNQTPDGGYIIYEGTIKDGKRWNLKMWIAKDYKENINNVSYEIRIKTK